MPKWVDDIKKVVDAAISNGSIDKRELAEGLEEIEDYCGEWAAQQYLELIEEDAEAEEVVTPE